MAGRAGPSVVVQASFDQAVERLNVLDRAHHGNIEGALGTVSELGQASTRQWSAGVRTLLAIAGPGLIVMAADNDAGGVSIYAQAGQRYGLRSVALILLLAPVLFVVQEMVARLGAVTGAGHARLIFDRFGRRWGRFAVADLLALNFLTLVTEFIGVGFAARYFGVSRFFAVPATACLLVAVTVRGRFRGWERAMLGAVSAAFLAVPLAGVALHNAVHVRGVAAAPAPANVHGASLLFVMAVVGTTVAPWQLFFQQSNVVDKRITSKYIGYERLDTALGTFLFAIVAIGVVVAGATVLHSTSSSATFTNAGQIATALDRSAGPWVGGMFALVLLNGALLGAAAITLSTSYAIGDATGLRQSLHRHWRDARAFHGSFALMIFLAAGTVLIPGNPLGLVTVIVSVLAGVLLPSAVIFLLLLCNDRAVLGPWVNPRWLNVLATVVASGLVVLSAVLVTTTLFPRLDVQAIAITFVALAAFSVGATAAWTSSHRTDDVGSGDRDRIDRDHWSMPPLACLPQPKLSRSRLAGLVVLRIYLIGAAALVVTRGIVIAVR